MSDWHPAEIRCAWLGATRASTPGPALEVLTLSHIWSNTSMPSWTFFKVRSISCCSFLLAPMVHLHTRLQLQKKTS